MDAPTAGVLRDVAILVWIALLLGSLAYSWLRTARPTLAWNWGGQVNARPYNVLDAVVVAAISVIILSALRPGQEDAPKADVTAAPLVSSIAVTLVICSLLLSYLLGIRGLHPVELFGLRRLNFFKCVAAAFFFMLPTWI
ncbi:MAG TPA: hypothetical protein VD994_19300, partial [Prosthecobacter sp.]|nr:hypothetical protein [Prosthecobacter sp.]